MTGRSAPYPEPPLLLKPWFLALTAATLFFGFALSVLSVGHPEEDAYILHKYVAELVSGHGIVFYEGGPRCEGFVDFLWLLAVAALAWSGVDIVISAAIWSAAAAGLATWSLQRAVPAGAGVHPALRVLYAVWTVLFPGALAAYTGFSTLFFSALTVWGMHLFLGRRPGARAALPLYTLVLGMVRPEGFVIGAVFAFCALPRVIREGRLRSWLWAGVIAGALLAAYLWLKELYFGDFLATPFHVKSRASMDAEFFGFLPDAVRDLLQPMRGLGENLRWLRKDSGGLAPLLVLIVLSWVLRKAHRESVRETWLALAPAGGLLVMLTFAHQIQNVYARFQAPALLCLVYAVWRLVPLAQRSASVNWQRRGLVLLAVLAVLPSAWRGVRVLGKYYRGERTQYTHVFAARLGEILGPHHRFALTEAGILAYYSRSQLKDAVGLNDPELARVPVTVEHLRAWGPDVVMCHQTFAVDREEVPWDRRTPAVVAMPKDALQQAILPQYRWIYDGGMQTYAGNAVAPPIVAAVVIAKFLVTAADFEVYAVCETYENIHFWGIRRDLPEKDAVLSALRSSLVETDRPSYLDLVAVRAGDR